MASKYQSTGTSTWTASTRTIAAATMTPVFEAGDQTFQRQVFFRIGANLYWGRVATYVSATSVVLLAGGSLPGTDGTIAELFLLDTGEVHTYQSYKDQIASLIKDDAAKLSTTSGGDIEKIIAKAINQYNRDKPWYVSKKVQGNGSANYVLTTIFGSLWSFDYTMLERIEYPIGDTPETYLESKDWTIYDDGTAQNGSNLVLRLRELSPAITEYFNCRLKVERTFPSGGVANYPDTTETFTNITTLAASHACAVLAAAYTPSVDNMISVDNVQHNEKTRKYMELSRMYREQYYLAVFGTTDPDQAVAPAFVDADIDLGSVTGGSFHFHGGRNR